MTDRYTPIYDEDDFILDNKTGEYLTLEDACNILNDREDEKKTIADFFGYITKKLEEAEEEDA